MTDTPPRFVPYVPGPLDQTPAAPAALPPAAAAAKTRTPLVAAFIGLIVVVVGLAGAVLFLANRSPAPPVSAATSAAAPMDVGTLTATAAWSPPPPQDISVAFGETLRVTDNVGDEIHYTVTADKTYTKTKYGTKPDKGIFYGIKVTIEVVAGSTYVCACDYALIAVDGTAYEGQSVGITGGLDALKVNKGQKAVGVVAFDIPDGAHRGGRVELRDGGGSAGNQGFWKIP